MRDILRAAIEAEKDNLLRALDGAAHHQRAPLLEEIAACDSLLGRFDPPRGVLYQIRDRAPRKKPIAKREAGPNTDNFAIVDARPIYRGL